MLLCYQTRASYIYRKRVMEVSPKKYIAVCAVYTLTDSHSEDNNHTAWFSVGFQVVAVMGDKQDKVHNIKMGTCSLSRTFWNRSVSLSKPTVQRSCFISPNTKI
jgi:hypothetical protein